MGTHTHTNANIVVVAHPFDSFISLGGKKVKIFFLQFHLILATNIRSVVFGVYSTFIIQRDDDCIELNFFLFWKPKESERANFNIIKNVSDDDDDDG